MVEFVSVVLAHIEQEELIHFDCVLLEQPESLSGIILCITSWFYNEKNLEFLR